jgi:hypothetical protein
MTIEENRLFFGKKIIFRKQYVNMYIYQGEQHLNQVVKRGLGVVQGHQPPAVEVANDCMFEMKHAATDLKREKQN